MIDTLPRARGDSPSVTDLFAQRVRDGYVAGSEEAQADPYRLALIFQGGAMRASIAAGGAPALASLIGDSMPFDESHHTSAGAHFWGTMTSDHPPEGVSIYYEELAKGFITPKNLLTKGKLVDLSLLINAVADGPKAFDFDALRTHPTETYFYGTSTKAERIKFAIGAHALDIEIKRDADGLIIPCKTKEEILTALEATAQIPFYAGEPVRLPNGVEVMDGGMSTAGRVPLFEAIDGGSTHVLIMATDKITDPDLYERNAMERLAARMISRKYPELAERYWIGHGRHIEVLRILKDIEDGKTTAGLPKIHVMRADPKLIPSSFETNPQKLYTAAKAGEHAVLRTFAPYGLTRDAANTVRPPRSSRPAYYNMGIATTCDTAAQR